MSEYLDYYIQLKTDLMGLQLIQVVTEDPEELAEIERAIKQIEKELELFEGKND